MPSSSIRRLYPLWFEQKPCNYAVKFICEPIVQTGMNMHTNRLWLFDVHQEVGAFEGAWQNTVGVSFQGEIRHAHLMARGLHATSCAVTGCPIIQKRLMLFRKKFIVHGRAVR